MVNNEMFSECLDAFLKNKGVGRSDVEDGLKSKLLSWLEEKEGKFLEICDGETMLGYTQDPLKQAYLLGFKRGRNLDSAENFKAFMGDKFGVSFGLGQDRFSNYDELNGSNLFIRHSRTEHQRDKLNKSGLISIKHLGYITYWQRFDINSSSGKFIDRIYLTSTGIVIPDLNVIEDVRNKKGMVIVDNVSDYVQSEHRLIRN